RLAGGRQDRGLVTRVGPRAPVLREQRAIRRAARNQLAEAALDPCIVAGAQRVRESLIAPDRGGGGVGLQLRLLLEPHSRRLTLRHPRVRLPGLLVTGTGAPPWRRTRAGSLLRSSSRS